MMKFRSYLITIMGIFGMTITPIVVSSEQQVKMDVHLIDVGQGDSILIKTPNNKVILIDGGPPKAGKKVVNYLKKKQIDTIDLIIATHPHIDHIGGLPHVMNEIKVKQILDTGKLHTTLTYAKYISQIRKQKIPMKIAKQNQLIHLDPSLNIQILNAYERPKNNNQSSIALKIRYKNIDFLFLSDIEEDQEKYLAETYHIEADFVKVAHHGSKTSSSLEFIQQVNPKVALLTYSKKNKYGHPVKQVIDNLNTTDAHIYSTAVFGDVVIHTNGKGYLIFTERSPIDGLLDDVS